MYDRLDARLRELSPGAFHDLVVRIAEIDAFRGWWTGCQPGHSSVLERLAERVAAISADASARIERSDTSGAEVRPLGSAPGDSRVDDREGSARVAAYGDVLRAVFDRHGEMPFGEPLMLQLHARLVPGSPRNLARPGAYRSAATQVATPPRRSGQSVALDPTVPHLAAAEMRVATNWTIARLAAREIHPLLVIAGFVLEFLAIRPFASANGRLSRILTNLLLLQCGYAHVAYASLERVIADRQTEYYLALRRSQANRNLPRPDITPWLYAFLDAVRTQIAELRPVIERWPDDSRLSRNQLDVLDLLARGEEVTNRLVCHELGIARDTAKQVLGRLVALGRLRREGSGRAVRYRRAAVQGTGGAAR